MTPPPPYTPQPWGWAKKNAIACPIHVSNSHTKFGLGGDSITDRRTITISIPFTFLKSMGIMQCTATCPHTKLHQAKLSQDPDFRGQTEGWTDILTNGQLCQLVWLAIRNMYT